MLVVDPSLESRLLRLEVERVTSINESSVKNYKVVENLLFRLLSALDSGHCKHRHNESFEACDCVSSVVSRQDCEALEEVPI